MLADFVAELLLRAFRDLRPEKCLCEAVADAKDRRAALRSVHRPPVARDVVKLLAELFVSAVRGKPPELLDRRQGRV
jgi:hypothetical protein